jgi:hypothetical protein
VDFECRRDNGRWSECTSPQDFTVLSERRHKFDVRAVDPAGNVSRAAETSWKVDKAEGPGLRFEISGGASAFLYPGVWRQIPLTITNPNNFAIFVTKLEVGAADAPGCAAAANIELQQADVDATDAKRIEVPANGVASVPAARRPQIRLIDLPAVNQDACRGKTFSLSYTGEATK